jgi:hypothetical protein
VLPRNNAADVLRHRHRLCALRGVFQQAGLSLQRAELFRDYIAGRRGGHFPQSTAIASRKDDRPRIGNTAHLGPVNERLETATQYAHTVTSFQIVGIGTLCRI